MSLSRALPPALGMLRVSEGRKTRTHTVLLTGDGGDDVFLGYPFFHNAWRAQKLARRLPPGSPILWGAVRPIAHRVPALGRVANFLDYTMGGIGAYARVRLGIPFFEKRDLLGEALLGGQVAHRQVPASFASAKRLVSDVLQFHRRMHFTSEFMTKVDGGTMYYSLEARAPFVDQSMWEFAARLPPAIHFHGGQLKAVLREIVRRHVGRRVAFRAKQGFTIPAERWLASKWKGQLNGLKDNTLLASQGWIEPKALSTAVDEALTRNEVPKQLWYSLVLESWLRGQMTPATVRALGSTTLETSGRL